MPREQFANPEEYRPDGSATRDNRLPSIVVWIVATVAAFAFVAVYGVIFPWADEWEFIPALLNQEAFTPWLWTQHNEHRLPLPRVIYYGLFQLTHDFRAGMIFQILLVSATAWRAMRYLQTVRGRASWLDLCVPPALLHFGHAENWLMGYQICFALVLALTTELTVQCHGLTEENLGRRSWIIAALACASALCGGAGLMVVPGAALWLGFVAVRRRRWLLLLPALALPLYVVLYFQDYAKPAHHPQATWADLPRGLVIAGEFLAMSCGLAAGIAWPLVTTVLLMGFAAAFVHLAKSRRDDFPERTLALAMLLLVALGSATAVGYGRAGFEAWQMGIASRYAWLAWPGLYALFLIGTRRGQTTSSLRGVFLIAFVGLTLGNTAAGIHWAMRLHNHLRPFTADCRDGLADDAMIENHLEGGGQEERAVRGLPMLRAANIGPFAEGDRR